MERILDEKDISVTFQGVIVEPVKFDGPDGNTFFTKIYQNQPEGKSVDFAAVYPGNILLLEVKDCREEEMDNLWRIGPDGTFQEKEEYRPEGKKARKKAVPKIAPIGDGTKYRVIWSSLDIEVAKKVLSTIAGLYGAWTVPDAGKSGVPGSEMAELIQLWSGLTDSDIPLRHKEMRVVLLLEGDFGNDRPMRKPASRTHLQVLHDLQKSIQKKLSWLNCTVAVVDSEVIKELSPGFTVTLHERLKRTKET